MISSMFLLFSVNTKMISLNKKGTIVQKNKLKKFYILYIWPATKSW